MERASIPSTALVPESRLSRLLFGDARLAPLWLLLRAALGWLWLSAGLGKLGDPAWTGANAGQAVSGFLRGALEKAGGDNPQVTAGYAAFVERVALPNATLFSYLVTFGEVAVGLALILGLLTGLAAFFGGLMNMAFLLAGTVSGNPVMLVLAVVLMLGWRVAGWWGLDRFVLPRLGVRAGGRLLAVPGRRSQPS